MEWTSEAIDHALSLGLCLQKSVSEAVHAPFSLKPTSFPKHCFWQAVEVQKAFQWLVHQVASDSLFVSQVMER
jgi:hypothetical protein